MFELDVKLFLQWKKNKKKSLGLNLRETKEKKA